MKLFDLPEEKRSINKAVKSRTGTRKKVSDSKHKCDCPLEKLKYLSDSISGESIYYCFECKQFKKVAK